MNYFPALIFDTETSDKPIFGRDAPPADDPRQPHILQLAACLAFEDEREDIYIDRYVLPAPGLVIAQSAFEKHGITIEALEKHGVALAAVLDDFDGLYDRAEILASFNMQFDTKLLRGARRRCGRADGFGEKLEVNIMHAATKPCNLPPTPAMLCAGRNYPKTPNLGEAVQVLVGRPHGKEQGAHNALNDCRAAVDVYRWLAKRHLIAPKRRESYPDHGAAQTPPAKTKAPAAAFGPIDASTDLDVF
jgi:DNA polymerase-3 subunit epsilon